MCLLCKSLELLGKSTHLCCCLDFSELNQVGAQTHHNLWWEVARVHHMRSLCKLSLFDVSNYLAVLKANLSGISLSYETLIKMTHPLSID